MKKTLKKTAAMLTALLMLVQIVPALAGTYSSGIVIGGTQGYREMLEIVASKGTYVLVGQELELDVNEGYHCEWTSEDETIATVDEKGVLTALVAGEVKITATEGSYSASTVVTVIDPEPLMAEVQAQDEAETEPEGEPAPEAEPVTEPEAEPETEPEAEPAGEPEEEPENEPAPQAKEETPVQKQYMIIVINGESTRFVYDGEEHTTDTFVATSNQEFFDESKIRVVGEIGVSATDCGTYEFKLDESNFAYDDANVVASFVVNNSWMKITPAQVTVTANPAEKDEGTPDPELTATVVGLYGEDTIEYTLERMPGEGVGEYIIDVYGEEKQGNYRISYVAGKLTINGEPEVRIESSLPSGQPVYAGTEITLKAVPVGYGDVELSYQWQYSTDGTNWTNIEGETGPNYTFMITKENARFRYRVEVNPIN